MADRSGTAFSGHKTSSQIPLVSRCTPVTAQSLLMRGGTESCGSSRAVRAAGPEESVIRPPGGVCIFPVVVAVFQKELGRGRLRVELLHGLKSPLLVWWCLVLISLVSAVRSEQYWHTSCWTGGSVPGY